MRAYREGYAAFRFWDALGVEPWDPWDWDEGYDDAEVSAQ